MISNADILVFLFGLLLGSFLNVIIYRVDDLRSIFLSRSQCPHCKKKLPWYDLIPLVSFILLKARCRHCRQQISWQYPVVELGEAILLVSLFSFYGLSWGFVFYALIFALLLIVFVYDIKTQTIPEPFVWVVFGLALLLGWKYGGLTFWQSLWGGATAAVAPLFLVLISREKWMGAGDIKVALILGLLLGFPTAIFGLLLAFVLGSLFGIVLIVLRLKSMKDQLPFAPFLIAAALIGLLYGQSAVNWYLGISLLK